MSTESAIRFETEARVDVALAVTDLDRSVAFCGILLGKQPTKRRPGYARFEVAEPPLNLALNEVAGPVAPGHPAAHFGIQVQSSGAVARMAERLAGAGLGPRIEKQVSCCDAVQDKAWVADPDGNKWEVFVVTDDEVGRPGRPRGPAAPTTLGGSAAPASPGRQPAGRPRRGPAAEAARRLR